MNTSLEFNTLLVPVDFSAASEAAISCAQHLAAGKQPVLILLHVIDVAVVELAVKHGWGSRDEVAAHMRRQAEQELAGYRQRASGAVEVDAIVCEGLPFVEILRKSEDFDVDAIVIGKAGRRGPLEKLLFGSTAEKVLRGSRRPVIVLPVDQ